MRWRTPPPPSSPCWNAPLLTGTEEMRIVESGEQLVRPKRRFDAVAVRGS